MTTGRINQITFLRKNKDFRVKPSIAARFAVRPSVLYSLPSEKFQPFVDEATYGSTLNSTVTRTAIHRTRFPLRLHKSVFTFETSSSALGARREKSIATQYTFVRFDLRTLETPLSAKSVETPFVSDVSPFAGD